MGVIDKTKIPLPQFFSRGILLALASILLLCLISPPGLLMTFDLPKILRSCITACQGGSTEV